MAQIIRIQKKRQQLYVLSKLCIRKKKVGSFFGTESQPRISHSALVPVIVGKFHWGFVFYYLLTSPFTDPACSDWSHKLWSTEQNWLIIHRWPKHTDINTHTLAELCWWGPLCELPVWGCMGCDGGPWTLNAVLLFSADFMPLLSFTHSPNKQQRMWWELLFLHFLYHFFTFSFSFVCFTNSSLQVQ